MHTRSVIICLGLAWLASAVPAPLNINLGAYSPALVVGDGAISFGGEEAAAEGGERREGGGGAEAAGAAAGAGEAAGAGGEAGAEAQQQNIANLPVRYMPTYLTSRKIPIFYQVSGGGGGAI